MQVIQRGKPDGTLSSLEDMASTIERIKLQHKDELPNTARQVLF